MRKILLVHNERYLDRALHDVLRLVGFEQQLRSQDEVLDLLAVILMPPSGDAHVASQVQTCELGWLTNDAQIFSLESVSVSGIWSLLTVSQSIMANSMKRQEALSRILKVLQVKEGVRNISAVIPVFPSNESQDSIAEQIAYLEREHDSILVTSPSALDFHESPPTLRRVGLCTVPE